MKGKIVRIFLISMLFISIFSPLSGEELWLSGGTGVGVVPGAFSSVSFANINGTVGLGIHEMFKTPLRSDIELTYAGYVPSAESTGWVTSIHGFQFALLPGYKLILGDSFSLTPRVGIGIQILFTSSALDYDDFQEGVFTNQYGTQLLFQAGMNADIILSDDWTIGCEGGYRMLGEATGVHHGALFKLAVNRKLTELGKNKNHTESVKLTEYRNSTGIITPDKLVPLKGMNDVLFYQNGDQLTIILLNSFKAYESIMTEDAGVHLAVVGEYLQELQSSRIGFYGYVADVQEDEAELDEELSLSRAEAVRDWLAVNGYIDSVMETEAEGRSGSNPIGDNATEEGRALNRRVEMVIDLSNEGDRK